MCEQSHSIEAVLQRMQSSLACTICLDLLNNPMTTKCGHTFCRDCLDRLLQGSRGSAPCPLCVTSVTKRSVKQTVKITRLVNAVRSVITSIKGDCGFQEPHRNKDSGNEAAFIPGEEPKLEEHPIRRGTRKREPASHFEPKIFPSKKRTSIKNTKSLSTIESEEGTCMKTTSAPNLLKDVTPRTEIKSDAPLQNPSSKEENDNSKLKESKLSPIPVTKPTQMEMPLGKVEQWLHKNKSMQFEEDVEEESSKSHDVVADIDDNIAPTQIFDEKGEEDNKIVDSEGNVEREHKIDLKTDLLSQASTTIFKLDDLKTQKKDQACNLNMAGSSNDLGHEIEHHDTEEKEETASMKSENENNQSSLSFHGWDTGPGGKHVLAQSNKINPTTEIDVGSVENTETESCMSKLLDNTVRKEYSNLAENKTKLCSSVAPVNKHHQSILGNDEIKQPNSKGHNIRFASEIKTKLSEPSKPGKLTAKSKKSPGWSRIEGARRDLRSKHMSLDIQGGEQKNTSDIRMENSKVSVDSSQESVIIIEEDQSQLNVNNLLNQSEKKDHFKKFRSIVSSLKGKNVDKSKSGNTFRQKAKTLMSGTKRKEPITDEDAEGQNVDHLKESYKLLKADNDTVVDDMEAKSNVETEVSRVESIPKTQDPFHPTSNLKINANSSTLSRKSFDLTKCALPDTSDPNCGIKENSPTDHDVHNTNSKSQMKELNLSRSKLSRKPGKNNLNSQLLSESKCESSEVKNIPLKTCSSDEALNNLDLADTAHNTFKCSDFNPTLDKQKEAKLDESCKGGNVTNTSRLKETDDTAGTAPDKPSSPFKATDDHCLKKSSVPFYFKGNFTKESGSCHHYMPCELFQVMMKFSSYMTSHYSQQSCLRTKTEETFSHLENEPLLPSLSHGSPPAPVTSPTKKATKLDENTEESVVPESCPSQTDQEVAVILPDEIPGVTLKLKDYPETSESKDCGMEEFESSPRVQGSKAESLELGGKEVVDGCEDSQTSQLSASVLTSVIDSQSVVTGEVTPSRGKPEKVVEPEINSPEQYNSQSSSISKPKPNKIKLETCTSNKDPNLDCSSYRNSLENSVNTKDTFRSSCSSKNSLPKSSSESPLTLKRGRRVQTLESSSSDDDDLPDFARRPAKKKRITSDDSSQSSVKEVAQIDSEELRDFERYDNNVWNYFNTKSKENDEPRKGRRLIDTGTRNTPNKPNEERGRDRRDSSGSTESMCSSKKEASIHSEDDDLIPGTAEVLKNVESDMAFIREMRESKGGKEGEAESEREGDDDQVTNKDYRDSQSSVVTTSTVNEMSASTRDLFQKCNVSLHLAQQILDEPFDNMFEDPANKFDNPNIAESNLCRSETEDTVNASHSSVLSTQSLVINTQQRNKVENEVETLRTKILALENEMKAKKATLTDDEKDKPTHSKQVATIVISDSEMESKKQIESKKEFDRDSDLESEELFKSFPRAAAEGQEAVTTRDARNKGSKGKKGDREKKALTLICTGLSHSETARVQLFTDNLGTSGGRNAKLCSKFNISLTTHVIVKTDGEGTTERTLKYLFGVASGAWIVSLDWITDSLSSNVILPEDEYEVLDCTGAPGPNRGRLLTTPLFANAQFFLIPPFDDVSSEQMSDLIKICGGAVVQRFNEGKPGLKLIVMNSEEAEKGQELAVPKKRNKAAVAHDWLIECIGMYSLVSLSNYVLGSPSAPEITASGIPESLLFETQELV